MVEKGQQQWHPWYTKDYDYRGSLVYENDGSELHRCILHNLIPKYLADRIVTDHNAHQDATELRALVEEIRNHVANIGIVQIGGWSFMTDWLPRADALLAHTAATQEGESAAQG